MGTRNLRHASVPPNLLPSRAQGLETPRYTVVRSWPAGSGALDGTVELRSYEPFTVARKSLATEGSGGGSSYSSLEGGGAGFNSLASYLFGENDAETAMGTLSSGGPTHACSRGAAVSLPRAVAVHRCHTESH